MTELPRYPEDDQEPEVESSQKGMHPAVKVAIVIAILAFLAAVVFLHMSGGGFRGPH